MDSNHATHSTELANYTRFILAQIIKRIYKADKLRRLIEYDDECFYIAIFNNGDRNKLVTLIENCRQNLLNKITPASPGGSVTARIATNDDYLITVTFKL